jgi:hypothetical protein
MTRYAREFLDALRQRYEETDQPMRPLALEFGIGISTLSAIVEREGWVKRSQRKRGRPEASLLSEAQALMASLPGHSDTTTHTGLAFTPEQPPTSDLSPPRAVRVEGGEKTAAERLETLLLQEIAAEEAARADLGELPRLRSEADACARRLAVMTQTLQTLQKLREAQPAPIQNQPYDDGDWPEDADAFRDELARRIRAFVASRRGDAGEDQMPAATNEDQGR